MGSFNPHGALHDFSQPERTIQRAGESGRSHQCGSLHPRTIWLDGDDAKRAGVSEKVYRRNTVIATVAMLYSVLRFLLRVKTRFLEA